MPILKSYSTNSSPMKAKLDRDADDDVYMTTLRANVKSMGEFLDNLPDFGVDPFGSTRLEIQGNNRAVDGSKTRPGSVRFTRNVTFCDINDEFPASNQQQTTPLEPLVSSHESGQVSSSEYSATPDTSLQDLKHLQHRTAQQLEYSCVGEQHCFESSSSHSTQLPKSTISVFSPANARTTSTTVSPAYEMSDSTHHLQDDTLSLASKFKDLSLDSVRKYEPQFSLRLCGDDDREKSLLPADDSYEQVDILDQEPPKLPNFKHINHSNVQGSAFLKANVDTERSSANWGFEKFVKDLLLLLKDSSLVDDGDWDFKETIARVHDGVKNLCRKVDLLQGDLGSVETRFSSLQQNISERDHAILKLKDRISHISLKASLLNNDLKTVRLQSAETTKMLASVNQSYSQLKNEMVTSESRARALCENEFFKAINEVCSTLTGKSVNSISDVIAMVEELSTLNNITKKQLEASKLTAMNLKFQVQELENQHETTSSEIQELSLELQNKKFKEMELTTALKEEQFSSQQKSQELLQCKAELKVIEASRDSTIAMKEQLEKQIDELQRSNAKLKLNFTELTAKATKMEEVINDQVTLMTSAQTELDTHMKTIVALESANRDSNDKVEELKFRFKNSLKGMKKNQRRCVLHVTNLVVKSKNWRRILKGLKSRDATVYI
ncbi:unnamed protein product [Cyberlindnera jadinii]|uniref:Uncharacterized protein n=1 Tax=Cyberlindnera jadinii (strain ATCC 18201 / CBS 1600 / BCRC 20928 / JCM 3617 / NBRC 0987 / NRRL Y-1542) TaxID=983966 RepID=A0A0H5C7J0_CYBJN|nr:unnamed protein product [Cyberlindnera jadinii]